MVNAILNHLRFRSSTLTFIISFKKIPVFLTTETQITEQMILKGNFNNICVCIIRKQSYMTHLGTKSTSPSNSVEVSVGILGHVVVEYNVDTFNVHTTAKQVGGHQDTLLEILELLVPTE